MIKSNGVTTFEFLDAIVALCRLVPADIDKVRVVRPADLATAVLPQAAAFVENRLRRPKDDHFVRRHPLRDQPPRVGRHAKHHADGPHHAEEEYAREDNVKWRCEADSVHKVVDARFKEEHERDLRHCEERAQEGIDSRQEEKQRKIPVVTLADAVACPGTAFFFWLEAMS
jgi:hypothetical protein